MNSDATRDPQPRPPESAGTENVRRAFRPGLAYWNQRRRLAAARERILSLSEAVGHPSDMWPYQFTQLMAAALEFRPDFILELGRAFGNSTCAFAEASHQLGGSIHIASICHSQDWELLTVPRLRPVVTPDWFQPLEILRTDILAMDYGRLLANAHRVLVFWDAHGFDIAECLLGEILPRIASMEHVVLMHDLCDSRYQSREHMEYGSNGLWKGNNWDGPRVKLGIIDSNVEQAIAAVDFTARNRLTLDSADHSFHTDLSAGQQEELRTTLKDLFATQGHWFYFTLNEHPGPYTFPAFSRQAKSQEAPRKPRWGWK